MYEVAFRKVDRNGDGYAEPQEVKEVLEASGLPVNEMKACWLLADITQRRTALNFAEFACALHMAFRRCKQGVPLPSDIPAVLRAIAASAITTASEAGQLVQPSQVPSESSTPPAEELSPSQKLQATLKAMEAGMETGPVTASGYHVSSAQVSSPQAATTAPVFFSSSSAAKEDPFDEALSVKELKSRLTMLGADFTGLAEKCELLALLKSSEASKATFPADRPASFTAPPEWTEPPAPEPSAPPSPPAPLPEVKAEPADDPFAGLIEEQF